MTKSKHIYGFPQWLSIKESACQCRSSRRCSFHPWVGKIPLEEGMVIHPVLLPGESHGQRSLVGYTPWVHKEWDTTEVIWHACKLKYMHISSVQFSRSVVYDSLRPHESQHTRPPCPSPTPGVYSNSCPLSWWCHLAISSSAVPFSSCPQSFPASGSIPMNQLFALSDQSTGVSTSASVLPMNTQDWSSLGWTGWSYTHIHRSMFYMYTCDLEQCRST